MNDSDNDLWKKYEFLNNQLAYLHGLIALADAKGFGLITLSGALLGWLTLGAASDVLPVPAERDSQYWVHFGAWGLALLSAAAAGFFCIYGTIRPRHRWHRRILPLLREIPPTKSERGLVSGPAVRAWGADDHGFANSVVSASNKEIIRELAFLYKKNYEISEPKYEHQLRAVWCFLVSCIFALVVAILSSLQSAPDLNTATGS